MRWDWNWAPRHCDICLDIKTLTCNWGRRSEHLLIICYMLCAVPDFLHSLFHLSLQHFIKVETLILQIRKLRQWGLILMIQDPKASKWKRWDLCPNVCIFWIDLDLISNHLTVSQSISGRRKSRGNGMELSLVCWGTRRRGGWVAGCHYICFEFEVTLVSECSSTRGLSYLLEVLRHASLRIEFSPSPGRKKFQESIQLHWPNLTI